MAELPTGTVTFLFTDIEGSTRLWQQDAAAMEAAVARHDELLRSAIEAYGGTVFSTMGDGIAAAFRTASAAVAAALEAQRQLSVEEWATAQPLRVRMGLHTGEAQQRAGDYFGTTLNRTARLAAVGHGGQVLCSAATATLVETEVARVDLGEHRLRDLDRPLRVFQIGEGAFAPLRSLDAFPGNLPAQRTSFVGRERELDVIAEALGQARLVTVTGTGGVGKTRLAVQAAAHGLPSFPDGAWLCELAAAADPDSMRQVVATSLGFLPRQGVTLGQGIAEFIGSRRLLIVLDNCEHLLDAVADLVETILGACSEAQALATSREALDIAGERVIRLRSLPIPAQGAALGDLVNADAARLFLERAEAVGGDSPISEIDATAIAEVCRRLDGIPLAIELAAARMVALAPAEIAGLLNERFRLLTGGRRAAVERHQTLRATVDWSYGLLGDIERAVFDGLGVFPATFDAKAAQAVAAGGVIEPWDVLDALSSLVAKSMVVADRSQVGETRYQLLETLRAYARERLDAAGTADEYRRRHAIYFAEVAAQTGAGLKGAKELDWRVRLDLELDNFRTAVFWGLDSTTEDDAELAIRVISELGAAGVSGWTGVAAWAELAVERAQRSDPRRYAEVLATAAPNAFFRGDFDRGRRYAREALRIGPTANSPSPARPFVTGVMFIHPDRIPALVAEGVDALDAVGAQSYDYVSLRTAAASMAALGGNLQYARAEAEETLTTCRVLGNPSSTSVCLYALALATWRDDPTGALAAFEESIALIQAGATSVTLGRQLAIVAQIRASLGEKEAPVAALSEAVKSAHADGDRPTMATIFARATEVLARIGELTTAAVFVGLAQTGIFTGIWALPQHEMPDHEQTLQRLRSALGDAEFADHVAKGSAMTYDETVTFALRTLDTMGSLTQP